MFYAAMALIPSLLLLTWLYTRDRLHPEPKRAVYRLYLRGAAIVLPAGLLERTMLGAGDPQSISTLLLSAFAVAGVVEEFLKAAIVERAAYSRGWMNNPLDAIIYAGATALGFATVENILYVTSSGLSTAALRAVTAVPAHLMFGILMGTLFSQAARGRISKAWAYIVPAIAHGIYDGFALSGDWVADVALLLYLVILLEICLRRLDIAVREQTQ